MMKQRKSKVNLIDSCKRPKNNTNLDDRISVLPDSIRDLILSCLPTKEAVATSILSKRWYLAWVTIPSPNGDKKFIRFVNRVLRLHDPGLLNKFSLSWDPECISSRVASSWINKAIARNVHDLSLSIDVAGYFRLPKSVFTCDSLQSLELNGYINVPTSILVSLPRLESLYLRSVDFECEEAFENLMRGCPVLDSLCLNTLDNDDMGVTYVICSTSLRRVELLFEYRCKVILKASSLEYLDLSGRVHEIFVQESPSSLIEAYCSIDLFEDEFDEDHICNKIVESVRALDCAKSVSLSADVMLALSNATISLSTVFKKLETYTHCHCCLCKPLQDLIQSSDNLEFLSIYQHSNYHGRSHCYHHLKWTNHVEVPRCLANTLKKVRLEGYKGLEYEREMILYMLKHGSVLEIMQIPYDYDSVDENFELLRQEMCEAPRKSPACKVEFPRWTSKKTIQGAAATFPHGLCG